MDDQVSLSSVLSNEAPCRFLPASAEKIETVYLQTVHFKGPLRKAKTDDSTPPVMIQGGLSELIRYYDRLAAPKAAVQTLNSALTQLIQTASPDLRMPLSQIHHALQEFAAQPSPQTEKKLLNSEQNFFRDLERHLVLEKFLSDTEQQERAPGSRFYLTFLLIDYENHLSRHLLPELTQLLEKEEKETGK